MKNFKRILCFVLMIPIMIGIVACGDKKGGKGGGSSNGDDSRTTLTTNQILNKAFTSFDADTKKQIAGKNSYASKVGNDYVYAEYDEYVYIGMSLLNKISTLSYTENEWSVGLKNNGAVQKKANNVTRFLVETEKDDEETQIDVYVAFSLAGLDESKNTKSFVLFSFEVEYEHDTEKVEVSARIEKSVEEIDYAGEIVNSSANYYTFAYANNVILARSFYRAININIQNNLEVHTIQNRKGNRFNLLKNEALQISAENITDALVKDDLLEFAELEGKVFGALATRENVNLTSNLSVFADAGKIADLSN